MVDTSSTMTVITLNRNTVSKIIRLSDGLKSKLYDMLLTKTCTLNVKTENVRVKKMGMDILCKN